uniref:Uncharacterized protein n=1 Tax=Salix viminalis TaxID=40686 RepID=A0A6N2NHX2_SALVM
MGRHGICNDKLQKLNVNWIANHNRITINWLTYKTTKLIQFCGSVKRVNEANLHGLWKPQIPNRQCLYSNMRADDSRCPTVKFGTFKLKSSIFFNSISVFEHMKVQEAKILDIYT